MGKKNKKTRWRTFTLNGQQSDSEESSTPSSISHQNYKNYHSNKYYNSKFTYSSQSTPTRKYQNDSSKTTRSNSTTSEHKTTFNEDEYTRITTPRQDVLFKKGYLNKPKNYQTQTSTGTSSTANSTSTCTPDHQSADGTEGTDLEYESQFVFPNGFIDHHGIYYMNSYEPFPFVVYNTPICYPEYQDERSKRFSTDSGLDSVSPQNEETMQNGVTQPSEYLYNNASASDNSNEEPPRIKRKRRRKISRTKDEESASCDTNTSDILQDTISAQTSSNISNIQEETSQTHLIENEQDQELNNCENDSQTLLLQGLTKQTEEGADNKYPLKPDAEEFIPRTFQTQTELPYDTNNIQYVNFAPGYISVPYINHNPTFLPPGIPINYLPITEPKFVNVIVPSTTEPKEQLEEVETAAEVNGAHEQTPPINAPIDIATIVSKLEEAVVEQNKREHQQPTPKEQVKTEKYQRQKNYNSKPPEKPKSQQFAQTSKTTNPNNYSETLKKNVEVVRKKQSSRYEKTLQPSPVIKPRPLNEWISVSSRKKKRKGINEQQNDFEEVVTKEENIESEDLFESFDVNLLEDVVPQEKLNSQSESSKTPPPINDNNSRPVDIVDVVEPLVDIQVNIEIKKPSVEKVEEKPQKKVQKKKVQKLPTKRIIIKDELQYEDVEPIKPDEPKLDETKPMEIEVKQPEVKLETEPCEKKKKKKKKVLKLQSTSSSTTTLSNLDDSYDFLLEDSIMEDSDQKTNIEMSQAFDLIIQKGMYNSLEEKIKALKVGPSEVSFFNNINFGMLKPPTTPAKQIFAHQQFDNFFQKDFLKTNSDLKPPIFLENPTVNEIIKNVDSNSVTVEPNTIEHHTDNYPITQAVKNWLTKTRENTPDIELLKSPNTIYKELSVESTKTDDEVTLWSISPQNSQDNDLLDCWENDIPICKSPSQGNINGFHNGHVDEGEDVIEIYESKYGKNEDYLQLKAEVAEQQKATRNFPRHGNLPYRAICCNIM